MSPILRGTASFLVLRIMFVLCCAVQAVPRDQEEKTNVLEIIMTGKIGTSSIIPDFKPIH